MWPLGLMIPSVSSFLPYRLGCGGGWLTADVEQVCEEEGLLVEVLYGEDDGPIQAAPEGLLGAALVCDERLKHGTDHVQLGKKGTEGQVALRAEGQVAVPSYLPVLPSALKENCLKEAPITVEKRIWSYGNLASPCRSGTQHMPGKHPSLGLPPALVKTSERQTDQLCQVLCLGPTAPLGVPTMAGS